MDPKFIDKVDTGIVTNAPTTKVGWSIGRNVRFKPGAVYKTPGKTLLATVPGQLPIRAMFTFKGHDGVFRTIVCCDTKIFAYTNNFTQYTDIIPSPAPSSGANDVWSFDLIGGLPVLSNGVNSIWKWANYAGSLTALSNAPARARALATAQNRLIAGNVQEGANDFPFRVAWSGIKQPEVWAADLKGKAGGHSLTNNSGGTDATEKIQAVRGKGNGAIVYAERNVWLADPAEWPGIFTFDKKALDGQGKPFEGRGLIAPRCALDAGGVDHFMGQDDFHVIGGVDIGFPIRNSVFPNLNKSAIDTAFGFYKPSTMEVFYCVPTGSNTVPDTAFVYQVETKAWSICDCNYLCHTFAFDESGYTWDTLPYGSWDTISDSSWDDMGKTGILPYEVVGNAQGQILKLDDGNDDNGEPITGYIETGDVHMGNPDLNKIIDEVIPSLKPQSRATALLIQVGTRQTLHEDIRWSDPMPYTIGISRRAGFRKQGKYIRFRFYTADLDSPWILDGYGYKFRPGSSR